MNIYSNFFSFFLIQLFLATCLRTLVTIFMLIPSQCVYYSLIKYWIFEQGAKSRFYLSRLFPFFGQRENWAKGQLGTNLYFSRESTGYPAYVIVRDRRFWFRACTGNNRPGVAPLRSRRPFRNHLASSSSTVRWDCAQRGDMSRYCEFRNWTRYMVIGVSTLVANDDGAWYAIRTRQ